MHETIGHYEVLGLLGTGGSGTVYRARDTRVGRTVAVRVLGDTAADAARRVRFLEAAAAFTAVSHPHIATLFDVGEHRDCAYLVYEFVPGERLNTLAAGRPVNLRRALGFCLQVADALAEANSFGLVHGSLTPSAIVVTPKGHVKVLDFAISAWHQSSPENQTAARLARYGAALGPAAVGYLAPEQVLGQPADHRADYFALGAILYELLTGRAPFDAPNQGDVAVRIAQHTPVAPSRIQADVPAAVDAIVAKALAKDVGARYESAAMLAADLRSALSLVLQRENSQEVSQAAVLAAVPPARWRIALLLLLLAAALAVTGWTLRDAIRQTWHRFAGKRLPPVVAVMPFAVSGDDVSRAYVGSGVADEVARRLGQTPGVTVKGRSMIRAFAGKPPATVAAENQASLVLTGTIGPGPDGWSALDVRVELADGADGRALWSRRYGGPATDIGAVQARIARDVAERLGVDGLSAARDRSALRLVNPDAYDAYLQGREAKATGDAAKATTLFENAIDADHSLLEAQAALVEVLYYAAAFDASIGYADVRTRMEEAAEEADTADPDLAPVQLARGLSAPTLRASFQHLRRAIELDPSYSNAFLAVADVLRDIDPVQAIRFARRAGELDPTQPLAIYQQAAAHFAMGDYAKALDIVARGETQAPAAWWDALRQRILIVKPGSDRRTGAAARSVSDFAPGAVVRAMSLAAEGRRTEAIGVLGIVMRMNPGFCQARALLAGVTLQDGRRGEALKVAGEIQQSALSAQDQAPWARCAAVAAAAVGDTARSAYWISKAATDERSLRLWNATSAVLSPQAGIRQKTYPWSNVLNNTQVGHAVASMESALVRARADATKVLEGLNFDRN